MSTKGTWARKARGHVGTQGTRARGHPRHEGTQGRRACGHVGTQGTRARRACDLADSKSIWYASVNLNMFKISEVKKKLRILIMQ